MPNSRKNLSHLKDKLDQDNEEIQSEVNEFLQKKPGLLDNTEPKIIYTHATYSIPKSLQDRLKKLAKDKDITQSGIVVKALEYLLSQYEY